MSILIKGMEMPRHCGECGIEWCDRWKQLIVAGMAVAKERPSDCPIISVPPHGRLIDAEPIVKYVTDGLNSGELGYDAIKVMTEVEYAPTIIPAEEGET